MGNIVNLSISEKAKVTKRIDERLNGKLGLNLNLFNEITNFSDDLFAVEVDLGFDEEEGKIIGTQYTQTVSQNGNSFELKYTEAYNVWAYQLNKFETDQQIIKREYEKFKNSRDYNTVMEFLEEGGYDLSADSHKVMNVEQYSFDEETQESTQNFLQGLSIEIKEKDEVVGLLVFNENTLIQFNGQEGAVTFNEGTPIVVPLAGSKWKKCMAKCIGCGTWASCTSTSSCLLLCGGCANPLFCAFCAVCAVAKVGCLWDCRMCVEVAARPEECPV
ncbi:hypothetical protein M3685_12390 [Heyndrickxia oleronia]|uniref:hypothetical protein n=1 Tax=Heyndrickxia oleronia TaxID=38875 RepID=UPI00203A4C28|nr:hypothetical protein [Heyndrickxia oleronia]MCM3454721.1 hypothetical protein [Heyndrickxia oleronia]